MSKGFGTKQRQILAEVERRPWGFYLIELLPENHTESEYQSLFRAFDKLNRAGHVESIVYMCGPRRYRFGKVLIYKPGLPRPVGRPELERALSVKGVA